MASSPFETLFPAQLGFSMRRFRMEFIIAVAAWAIGSVCKTMPVDTNYALVDRVCSRNSIDVNNLASRLSKGAHVYYPGSESFTQSTARWSTLNAPHVTVTVEPATEDDVAATVKYANERNIPFLAVNSGHGAITTVGEMEYGIEIWMRQLRSVEIAEDGTTATFGGGVLAKNVTDALWAAGKQTGELFAFSIPSEMCILRRASTVTGGCECVGLLGPALGGGHGFLQGRYGLISDQFVSLNMVMADGSRRTIDERSDLWWAMQGAGHNFGIVTSVTSKIYDIKYRNWAYQSFDFTGDKVETLYDNINRHLGKNGTQPVDVMNYSFFFKNPAIDSKVSH